MSMSPYYFQPAYRDSPQLILGSLFMDSHDMHNAMLVGHWDMYTMEFLPQTHICGNEKIIK